LASVSSPFVLSDDPRLASSRNATKLLKSSPPEPNFCSSDFSRVEKSEPSSRFWGKIYKFENSFVPKIAKLYGILTWNTGINDEKILFYLTILQTKFAEKSEKSPKL
jgi:hypothetical protein